MPPPKWVPEERRALHMLFTEWDLTRAEIQDLMGRLFGDRFKTQPSWRYTAQNLADEWTQRWGPNKSKAWDLIDTPNPTQADRAENARIRQLINTAARRNDGDNYLTGEVNAPITLRAAYPAYVSQGRPQADDTSSALPTRANPGLGATSISTNAVHVAMPNIRPTPTVTPSGGLAPSSTTAAVTNEAPGASTPGMTSNVDGGSDGQIVWHHAVKRCSVVDGVGLVASGDSAQLLANPEDAEHFGFLNVLFEGQYYRLDTALCSPQDCQSCGDELDNSSEEKRSRYLTAFANAIDQHQNWDGTPWYRWTVEY